MSRQKVVKRDLKSCSRKHRSEHHDSVRRSAFPLSSRIERSSISIIEDPLSSDDSEEPPKFIKSYIKPNKDVFPFAEKLKEYYHKSPVTKRLLPVLPDIQSSSKNVVKRARLSDPNKSREIDFYKGSHMPQKRHLPEIHSNPSLATYQGQFGNSAKTHTSTLIHNTASMDSLEKETTTNSSCNSNVYRSEVEKQVATVTVPDFLCDLAVFDAFPVEDIIRALNKSGYAIVSSKLDLDQEEQRYFVRLSGVEDNSQTVKLRDTITASTERIHDQTERSKNIASQSMEIKSVPKKFNQIRITDEKKKQPFPRSSHVDNMQSSPFTCKNVKSGKFQKNKCKGNSPTLLNVFVDTLTKVVNSNVEARKHHSEKRIDRNEVFKFPSTEREGSPMSRILGCLGKDPSHTVSSTYKTDSGIASPIHYTDNQVQASQSSCKTPTTSPRSVLKKTICLNTSIDGEGMLTRNNRVRFSNPLVHVREFNTDSWNYENRCTSSNSHCSTDLEYVIELSSKCSPTRLRQSTGNKALLMPSKDKISYNHQIMEDSRCISDHTVHVTLNAFVPTSTGLEERRSQLNTTSNHQLPVISESNKHQTTQDLQHQLYNTNSVSLLNPENSVHTPENHCESRNNYDVDRFFIAADKDNSKMEVMLPSNTARHDSLRNYNAKVAESSSDPLRDTLVSGQTINEDFTNSLNSTCEETTSINKGQRSQKFLHCIICKTHGEKNLVEGSHICPFITCNCYLCLNNKNRLKELRGNVEQRGNCSEGPFPNSLNNLENSSEGLPTKIQLDFVYPPSGPSLGFISVEWDNTMGPIHDEVIIKYGQQLLKAQNEVKVKSVMDASLKSVRIIVKREELHKIVHETTDSIPEMCEAITNPASKLEINQLEVTNGLIALNKSAPELVSSIKVKEEPKDEDDVQLLFMGRAKYLEELYTSRCVDSKITENDQQTFSAINKENQLSSNEKNHTSSFFEHTNPLHVEGYVQLLENERKQKEPCQLPSPRVFVSSGFQNDSPVSQRNR